MNTNEVFIWLKEFKSNWIPQNISNDPHLCQSITNKIYELEQLLFQNNQNENRILIQDEDQSAKSNDVEQEQTTERPLLTLSDVYNQIDNETEKSEPSYRPSILIKRISANDAKRFMPSAWKIIKSKKNKKKLTRVKSHGRKNKKTVQTNQVLLSSTQDESIGENQSNIVQKMTRSKRINQKASTSSLTSIQSINNGKMKSKRKLRALDAEDDDLHTLGNLSQIENSNNDQISRYIGQNGILSQTRKTNETIIDDDFKIKLQSRQSNTDKILSTKCSKNSTISVESPIGDIITIVDDAGHMNEDQSLQDFMENNDHESLFNSFDIPYDKTTQETNSILNSNSIINYSDCIEDISNDGMDIPPSTSSPNTGQCVL